MHIHLNWQEIKPPLINMDIAQLWEIKFASSACTQFKTLESIEKGV